MASRSVQALVLLGGLAQCDMAPVAQEPSKVDVSPKITQVLVGGVAAEPFRFGQFAPAEKEENLPSLHVGETTWVDSFGVRDALRNCLQTEGVVCVPSSTDLACFSNNHGDHVPVRLRVRELGGDPVAYDVRVSPIFQDERYYSYIADSASKDALALACETGRQILSADDARVAEWCFDPEDDMNCDLWMTSAFEENEALQSRFQWLLALASELNSSGWHFELGLNGFSLNVADLTHGTVAFSIEWDYKTDQPTVLIQANGPLDWNAFWCEHPCYPEDAVRVLDSNAFLSTSETPVWMVPYAVSYPVSASF